MNRASGQRHPCGVPLTSVSPMALDREIVLIKMFSASPLVADTRRIGWVNGPSVGGGWLPL